VNRATGVGVVVPGPLQGDIEISVELSADKAVELQHFSERFKEFFARNSTLRSTGLDAEYTMLLDPNFDEIGDGEGDSDVYTSKAVFRIFSVRYWQKEAYEAPVARGLSVNNRRPTSP
jgi:hypothetical protein